MAKFITTSEKDDIPVLINIENIATIKETGKYHRDIYLNVKDKEGKQIIIQSQHSYKELNDMISQSVEV